MYAFYFLGGDHLVSISTTLTIPESVRQFCAREGLDDYEIFVYEVEVDSSNPLPPFGEAKSWVKTDVEDFGIVFRQK